VGTKKSDSKAMQDYYDGNGNHPGGRPTKYNPAILRKTKEYINSYEEQGDRVPMVAGLCKWLKLNKDTIYAWIKDESKSEFSDIVSRILSEQERLLINKGLDSGFNSNITKLMLVKHGYHDKQEVTAQIETKEVGNNELARRLAFVIAKGVTIEGECEQVDS